MSSLIFMFPGQTSRYPDMIEKLSAYSASCSTIVSQASDILGRDLARHYRADNPEIFWRNRDVQIGVFLATHLHMTLLKEAGITTDWSLGLSLGEYNHLVHIGALSFENGLPLIEKRGMLYEDGPQGSMVSVFPIDAEAVENKIRELKLDGRVVIGLYNSPRQQVLSGERPAVEQLVNALEEDALIEPVETEPRIPMHAPTFAPVADQLRAVLDGTKFLASSRAYVANVTGDLVPNSSPAHIRSLLTDHVHKSVRWQASIEALAAHLPEPHFVEVGPRSVLYNLFGRGWMPGKRSRTDIQDNWPDHMRNLIKELGNGA